MKLTHPDAPKRSIEPKAEHVPEYLTQGWVESVETAPKAAEKPADKK